MENKLQLAMAYAKQTNQYLKLLQQYEAQLKELLANPFSVLGPEIGQMITQEALSFSEKFAKWSDSSTHTLEVCTKGSGFAPRAV